mmetsp:Transcript_13317/g.15861  ORF Transcript_13317/g.15861 Transcript_13317/m.15861 type:complete len:273 (+) Transcript_13317:124-942(+)|eukprot:CAMPEP_0114335356 /NCGR_PEP_ID=MMETSP0101-20121206/5004_1 /TAXON_ID=38822 ORGANISM="Pteridomonas danica, Strain PT" /NCGR_SAMPLE_ID=MMETSP0101 /ASSEMBLY_ACC=CAM_ASM_000211 /LENGTH=272 /DNA_ID=CAMNT_0001466955 /DNA_START=54 /DNA_END=872 /DNA_ORIENTATION=+
MAAASIEVQNNPDDNSSEQFVLLKIQAPSPEQIGLKIICVSDTHDFHNGMKYKLPTSDILIHAGDFTCRGSKEEVSNFQNWMETLLGNGTIKHAIVIAGNHELSFQDGRSKHKAVIETQREMKKNLISVPNLHYLEDSGVCLLGIDFYGSPWTLPVNGKCTWAFQERDRIDEIGQRWKDIPLTTNILITHCPPYGQGDETEENKSGRTVTHGGSHTLLTKVLEINPLLHIFGHFHEGHGVSSHPDTKTTFVNAAICDEDYHPDHLPILIEFI